MVKRACLFLQVENAVLFIIHYAPNIFSHAMSTSLEARQAGTLRSEGHLKCRTTLVRFIFGPRRKVGFGQILSRKSGIEQER
jgi:hypothetical protein